MDLLQWIVMMIQQNALDVIIILFVFNARMDGTSKKKQKVI